MKTYKIDPVALSEIKQRIIKTKTIGDIYKTAGIEFNFTAPYIKQLMEFVKVELDKCI